MKLAAVTSLFKYYPLPVALDQISRAGYEGVELWGGLPHGYIEDFFDNGRINTAIIKACRRLVDDAGLKPVQFLPEQCFYPVNYAIGDAPPFEGHSLRKRSLDYFRRAVEVTAALEFPRMCVTTPFWGWVQSNGEWRHHGKHDLEGVIDAVGQINRHAERYGVEIVLEPLSYLETTGVETLDEVGALLTGVGSDNLKIMLDTGHIHVTARSLGRDSTEYFRTHIEALGDKLVHIHLSDNFGDLDAHLVPGEGSFAFEPAFSQLKAVHYDGYLSAELMMFGANPIPPTPYDLLVATREFVREAESRG
ncbi:sugar phosphate isomerase/epimerase family protein [Pelagibacterium lentulum]|uniref:Protein FrlC n=1 Tax=Pelagibacterium lentulum TaxID=2029865 RepID=A0A916VX71_9HYPH|nr:sugar phosphate isomerase/epimerase [Pelagibacterium lentulum]GGA48303.1 protein FrlC [Pelagibacterium lentulum]